MPAAGLLEAGLRPGLEAGLEGVAPGAGGRGAHQTRLD